MSRPATHTCPEHGQVRPSTWGHCRRCDASACIVCGLCPRHNRERESADPVAEAFAEASMAAICGHGTTGGQLTAQERSDIFWAQLERGLGLRKFGGLARWSTN